MRIKNLTLLLVAAAMTGAISAQPGGMGQQAPSTVINPDNTVTFRDSRSHQPLSIPITQ